MVVKAGGAGAVGLALLAVAGAGCGDDGPPAAVCDPFDASVPASLGLGEEPTVAAAVELGDRIAGGEVVLVTVYLSPDGPLGDLEALAGIAAEVGPSEALDQEAVYEDYQEVFADSPELLDVVQPSDLPTVVRVLADGEAAADRFIADAEAFDPYRVVDSRGSGLVSGRLLATGSDEGTAALEALAEQDDDAAVASAAQDLLDVDDELEAGSSATSATGDPVEALVDLRDEVVAGLATLAAVADDCG